LQSSVLKVRSEDIGSSGHAKHHSYKKLAHRHPLTQHSGWTHLQIEVGESVNNSERIYGVKHKLNPSSWALITPRNKKYGQGWEKVEMRRE